MEILAVIFTIIFATIHAKYDANLIEEGKRIKYPIRNIVRALVMIGFVYGVAYWQYLDWFAFTLLTLNLFGWFWLVFDFSINRALGNYEFYIGKTSTIDRAMRKVGVYYAIFIKLAVIFATGIGYVIYYDKLF